MNIRTFIIFLFCTNMLFAQNTAKQIQKLDCNGNPVDLYADLDSGKAVLLHFFMPNCGTCPPSAKKIQAMALRINAKYPGMVKGYALPYQNTTTCSYTASWVTGNGLSKLYIPVDSGAEHVAHYGGFGMPSIALLGGKNHRIMFFTMSFQNEDTTTIRDSIYALIGAQTGIESNTPALSSSVIHYEWSDNLLHWELQPINTETFTIKMYHLSGVMVYNSGSLSAAIDRSGTIDTHSLPSGIYILSFQSNSQNKTYKIQLLH